MVSGLPSAPASLLGQVSWGREHPAAGDIRGSGGPAWFWCSFYQKRTGELECRGPRGGDGHLAVCRHEHLPAGDGGAGKGPAGPVRSSLKYGWDQLLADPCFFRLEVLGLQSAGAQHLAAPRPKKADQVVP